MDMVSLNTDRAVITPATKICVLEYQMKLIMVQDATGSLWLQPFETFATFPPTPSPGKAVITQQFKIQTDFHVLMDWIL